MKEVELTHPYPPFANKTTKGLFLLFLVAVAGLPFWRPLILPIPKKQIYQKLADSYSYFAREAYGETKTVDMLIVGDSSAWAGLDAKFLEDHFKARNPGFTALNLSGNWAGDDRQTFVLNDFLQKRKVKLLIFNIGTANYVEPHMMSKHLLDYYDHSELLAGLPMNEQARYYALSILGNAIKVVDFFARNPIAEKEISDQDEMIANRGSLRAMTTWRDSREKFKDILYPVPSLRHEEMFYNGEQTEKTIKLAPVQIHFMKKAVELVRKQGGEVVFVKVPFFDEGFKQKKFKVGIDMSHFPGVPFISPAEADLYKDLTVKEVKYLYYNIKHCNKNGSIYFTKTILPGLEEVFNAKFQ